MSWNQAVLELTISSDGQIVMAPVESPVKEASLLCAKAESSRVWISSIVVLDPDESNSDGFTFAFHLPMLWSTAIVTIAHGYVTSVGFGMLWTL